MSISNQLASSDHLLPDFAAISARLQNLSVIRHSRRYEGHKSRDWEAFQRFLGCYEPPLALDDCGPAQVVEFLVHQDTRGRTVVHIFGCPLFGSRQSACSCPKRAAWGSLDSLVGRLQAAFHQWASHRSNPCQSRQVNLYLRDVKQEQLQSRVQPKQAVPLFEDKLTKLVLFLDSLLQQEALDTASRFVLYRDRAFFALDMQAWMRGADLAHTLTGGILWFPDRSGWLFGYTWGKTLRTGDRHVFGLRRHLNTVICPIRLVSEYVQFAQSVGVSLVGASSFLFRPVRQGQILNSPVAAETFGSHLQSYLRAAGIFEGETLHGLRSGGAISAALRGESLEAIMGQAHWSNRRMADRYKRLREVLGQGAVPATSTDRSLLANEAVQPADYRSLNTLENFTFVYPWDLPSDPVVEEPEADQ